MKDKKRKCAWCGKRMTVIRKGKKFCGSGCRAWSHLEEKERRKKR